MIMLSLGLAPPSIYMIYDGVPVGVGKGTSDLLLSPFCAAFEGGYKNTR